MRRRDLVRVQYSLPAMAKAGVASALCDFGSGPAARERGGQNAFDGRSEGSGMARRGHVCRLHPNFSLCYPEIGLGLVGF